MRRLACLAVLAAVLLPHSSRGQAIDSTIARALAQVRAIDDHTHASRALAAGDTLDPDSDAAQCPSDDASSPPARLVGGHPLMIRGWRAMYGYPYEDASPAHVASIPALRDAAWKRHGSGFTAWVLDQIGTETAFANRVAMGSGLTAPRFRWVPFVDALAFPLDNRAMGTTPDRTGFFVSQSAIAARYRTAAGQSHMPPTLAGYVRSVVAPTLERFRREGAVALKFELAYLRSLDVAPVTLSEASAVYARYARGGVPRVAEYRLVQDYLIREIARRAGMLGLPLQFHTGGGCGGYFDLAGSAPTRLTALIDDPALRSTRFVLLHGGGSFAGETHYMLSKSNVWADFSAMTFTGSPRTIADAIRPWLESTPQKVLFGTDFGAGGPGDDGAATAYLTTMTGREALVRALAALVTDGELSTESAIEVGRMVLRGNAIDLYRLPLH